MNAPNAPDAIDLFVEHLRKTESLGAPEAAAAFAQLCRDHPPAADELARLRADWERTAEIHSRLSSGATLFARLQQRFGKNVDPGVALDPEQETRPPGQDPEATRPHAPAAPGAGVPAADQESGLVSRLKSRSPGDGRYRMRDELGRGGMGIVKRVWDEDLRRHLAMKIIRDGGGATASMPTTDAESLGRFLEEAQITSQLRHPGIVPVHELGLDADGRTYFTMQLVQGDTFREVIDWVASGANRWTQTRAIHVLVDVCDALSYAHSKGVIHRDLKPANVMVGRFGETYVMDWGLARVLGKKDRHDVRVAEDAPLLSSIRTDRRDRNESGEDSPLITMDGAVVGTPAYMPPEQANGQLELIDRRADVYSVGAMLYHLLTGQPPYLAKGERTSPRTLLAMVKLGPPKRVHELAPVVPVELEAICEKAMARDPARRYADTREFAEDLRAYLENRVVKAHARGALVELKKWFARNRATAMVCAAALVMLVAGSVLFALEKTKANREINEKKVAAERHLADVKRLSDLRRLHDLQAESATLWPAWPEQAAGMRGWLERAHELRGHLELHRASLAELRKGAMPDPADAGQWRFADGERQWWHDTLAGLVRELEDFAGPDPRQGTIVEMERRLEQAESVEARTLDDHIDEWSDAIAAIADSPRYRGLRIHEQMGLLPIGADPASGLHEFWLVESGAAPERDPEHGLLTIKEATGIVLVLLPGGTFRMGVELPDVGKPPSAPNVDPQAVNGEGPVHEVTLPPFFLAKHEMTQGQWVRQLGDNPSWFRKAGGSGIAHSTACPVESVSWLECAATLAQLGLALPTEAQWEYAARAGTGTVWWTGNQVDSLRGAANLADRSLVLSDGAGFLGESWDDGHSYVAPVGTLRANAFGLHDVLGNVWEWCLDEYVDNAYVLPYRPSDGLPMMPLSRQAPLRVMRGGSWNHTSPLARCGLRYDAAPDYRSNDVGVRPARPVRE